MIDDNPKTNKALGQHWLNDEATLQAMADAVHLTNTDTVLEVGPGPGTLTSILVGRAAKVIAVEFDRDLARDLPKRVPAGNLQIVQQDILKFDLSVLPAGFKVAANIPYYLTSNLVRILCEDPNSFSEASLLMQKEVAERICAKPGAMSILSVSVQFYCEAELGMPVLAELFTPPPKVDSQILILRRRPTTLFPDADSRTFFRVVKAGFSQKRKTLLNSLSGGLQLSRDEAASLLEKASIEPTKRAQNLSMQQWYDLYKCL